MAFSRANAPNTYNAQHKNSKAATKIRNRFIVSGPRGA